MLRAKNRERARFPERCKTLGVHGHAVVKTSGLKKANRAALRYNLNRNVFLAIPPTKRFPMSMTTADSVLRLGTLEIKFMVTSEETNGSMMVFEMTVPAGCRVPPAHYHGDVDEVVIGLEGVLSFTAGGETRDVHPGDKVVVVKGVEHRFENLQASPARVLTIQTPGTIGPAYYREIADLINAGGPPDPAKAKEIMARHGLVVVPPKAVG
jgi:quercetin dioxygenase-like cupin family protein